MKKLLLLLLIAPMIGNSQNNDVYNININGLNFIGVEQFLTFEHTNINTEITVPENEYWMVFAYTSQLKVFVQGISEQYGYLNRWSDYSIIDGTFYQNFNPVQNLLEGGTRFYFYDDDRDPDDEETPPTLDDCTECFVRVIKFQTVAYQNSIASNEFKNFQNKSNSPVLFPNPTSSLLALNSDKEYNIEVYDMAGNKVMALTGNNINMAHLSTATYIVKATDKSNSEELTYKVVKN
jgi:hypothetical protein